MATKTCDNHGVKRMRTYHSVSCITNEEQDNQIFKPKRVCHSHSSGSLSTTEDGYKKLKIAYDITSPDDIRKHGASCKAYSASFSMDIDEQSHGWTIVDDVKEQCGDSCEDFADCALADKLTPEESNLYNAATSSNVTDSINSLHSSIIDERESELEKALRLFICSDEYLPTSAKSSRDLKAAEMLRMIFSDDQNYRKDVPVGNLFQAEIPEWTGPRGVVDDSEKWLGTKMYPIKHMRNEGGDIKPIGKGRSDTCSCVSPGSVGCVKHHIDEARRHLEAEIGPELFQAWKFDEMGESVSKSWTLKEQSAFESLVRRHPLSGKEDFWKHAVKRFPKKGRKALVRYYYNVYLNRRMSLQSRSSLNEFDSDEDQGEGDGG